MIFLTAALCGLTFHLPPHWTARVERNDDDASEHVACRVAIRPPKFSEIAEHSPWDPEDPPMSLIVVDTSLDDALGATGFEHDMDGALVVPSRGIEEKAERFRIGKWSGYRGHGWFRGYARRDAELPEGESHIYSGGQWYVTVTDGKRWVGIECVSGPPDITMNCDATTQSLLRSLR